MKLRFDTAIISIWLPEVRSGSCWHLSLLQFKSCWEESSPGLTLKASAFFINSIKLMIWITFISSGELISLWFQCFHTESVVHLFDLWSQKKYVVLFCWNFQTQIIALYFFQSILEVLLFVYFFRLHRNVCLANEHRTSIDHRPTNHLRSFQSDKCFQISSSPWVGVIWVSGCVCWDDGGGVTGQGARRWQEDHGGGIIRFGHFTNWKHLTLHRKRCLAVTGGYRVDGGRADREWK